MTNMQEMFNNTKSFNQTQAIWDVSKVTNMSNMFKNSIKMIQTYKIETSPVPKNWSTYWK